MSPETTTPTPEPPEEDPGTDGDIGAGEDDTLVLDAEDEPVGPDAEGVVDPGLGTPEEGGQSWRQRLWRRTREIYENKDDKTKYSTYRYVGAVAIMSATAVGLVGGLGFFGATKLKKRRAGNEKKRLIDEQHSSKLAEERARFVAEQQRQARLRAGHRP